MRLRIGIAAVHHAERPAQPAWAQTPAGSARSRVRLSDRSQAVLALVPAIAALAVCFYGFLGWTALISLTSSRLLPRYQITGFQNYALLTTDPRWQAAWGNLFVFGAIFIAGAVALGFLLAALLDASGRREGVFRTVFVLPLSISWLVTGLLWQWLLDPGFGIEGSLRALGFERARFDWLVRQDTALFAVALAGVWHVAGLVMAIFLAGLSGIDPQIRQAARIDGVPGWRFYLQVVLPMLRPHVLTAVVLLSFGVIRVFDLVVGMTGGGPGFATDMPALYMYDHAFTRGRLGVGAASAVLMLATMAAVLAPYLYLELGRRRA